jgi:hypothetical protein
MLKLELQAKDGSHLSDIEIGCDYVPRVGEVITFDSQTVGGRQTFMVAEVAWRSERGASDGKLKPHLICKEWRGEAAYQGDAPRNVGFSPETTHRKRT